VERCALGSVGAVEGRNCRPDDPSDTIVAGTSEWFAVSPSRWRGGPAINVSWEEKRKSFYQRRLKNKRKFSENWKKVVDKISKLDRRIANIRKDETHKFTSGTSKPRRNRAGELAH